MSRIISRSEFEAIKMLGFPEVKENNQWLRLHIKGDGVRAPESWNAKIYSNSAGVLKLHSTDESVLTALLKGLPVTAPALPAAREPSRVISIDDSGWGFPIGGTLIGLHDSFDNSIHYGEVKVSYYQSPCFEKKAYLWAAANVVVGLLGKLNTGNADTFDFRTVGSSTLFKVCTGYVNTGIVKELRERGFRVETCAIGEPLQSALEKEHRDFIKRLTNADVYYDPKDMGGQGIGRAFSEAVEWIQKNNDWRFAKTGWGYFKRLDACQRALQR